MVNGEVGAVVVRGGRLRFALTFTVVDDRITAYDVVSDPNRLRGLVIAVLD